MIRLAKEKDLLRLVELGEEYHAATILKDMVAYDPESAGILFLSFIDNRNCFVAVLETDRQVYGFIMGALVPLFFNRSILSAQMISWYVTPDKRGVDSMKLFYEWEKWTVSRGAKFISVGGQRTPEFKGMERLMRKHGYRELESMYVRGVV